MTDISVTLPVKLLKFEKFLLVNKLIFSFLERTLTVLHEIEESIGVFLLGLLLDVDGVG